MPLALMPGHLFSVSSVDQNEIPDEYSVNKLIWQ